MTNELTLREKVLSAVCANVEAFGQEAEVVSAICDALEDTGSPAHMRVAAELRGETNVESKL